MTSQKAQDTFIEWFDNLTLDEQTEIQNWVRAKSIAPESDVYPVPTELLKQFIQCLDEPERLEVTIDIYQAKLERLRKERSNVH